MMPVNFDLPPMHKHIVPPPVHEANPAQVSYIGMFFAALKGADPVPSKEEAKPSTPAGPSLLSKDPSFRSAQELKEMLKKEEAEKK